MLILITQTFSKIFSIYFLNRIFFFAKAQKSCLKTVEEVDNGTLERIAVRWQFKNKIIN